MDSRTEQLYRRVFGIELLREKIVNYVIHDGRTGKISRPNAISCRLVEKCWRDSVTRCLIKSGLPLFVLNIKNDKYDQFLDAYGSSQMMHRVPPFKLVVHTTEKSFWENKWKFGKCLRSCSSGLVDLELKFALTVSNSVLDTPSLFLDTQRSLSLPVLQKLSLTFTNGNQLKKTEVAIILNTSINSAIQLILCGCQQLTSFNLRGAYSTTKRLPPNFVNIKLPVTITKLETPASIDFSDLEQLILTKIFPRITDIKLGAVNVPENAGDVIYEFLYGVRRTLRTLKIIGFQSSNEDLEVRIRVPVMKCLKALSCGSNWEWDNRVDRLDWCFPEIRRLELDHASSAVLHKWTENSEFAFMNEIVLNFNTWGPFHDELEVWSQELARSVHRTFPRVTKLTVSTAILKDAGHALQYVFRNMTQLRILNIRGSGTPATNLPPRFWESLLVGVPIPMVEGMESCGEAVQLSTDMLPSIVNLSELRQLSLRYTDYSFRKTPMSDVLFQFALLKMPKLKNLVFGGKLQISSAMIRRWEQEGRKIRFEG